MASISDKVQLSTMQHLFIYKESAFWVAYEQSTSFMTQYKGFTPIKKQYIIVKNSAVSVGFSNADAVVNELMKNNFIIEVHKTETTIVLLLKEPINKIAFIVWKENLSKNVSSQSNSKGSIENL